MWQNILIVKKCKQINFVSLQMDSFLCDTSKKNVKSIL